MLHRYWCDGRDKETFYDIIHSIQCIFIDVILRWIKILKIVHPYVSRERLGTQKWKVSRKKEMRNKQDTRIRATLKIILFQCLNSGPTFHVNAGVQAHTRIYADFKHLNDNNLQIDWLISKCVIKICLAAGVKSSVNESLLEQERKNKKSWNTMCVYAYHKFLLASSFFLQRHSFFVLFEVFSFRRLEVKPCIGKCFHVGK